MKKSTKFILYFCLTLFLLNSCTTEKEFVEKNNSTKQYSIKEYTAKEADNLVKFQAIKQRIVKNLMNMSNNESSREVLGFTVDDSMMK